MHDAIRSMITRRNPGNPADWDRALREVLQETALAGLWRTGFFEKGAFYGGTALRLFYGLDRFSEDLDFTLLKPDLSWKLSDRLSGLQAEIEAFGFSVKIEPKKEGPIESAFIKTNTRINLITMEAPPEMAGTTAPNKLVKVKLEVDTDPPCGIRTENKILLEPFPVSVRVVTGPCLFAGKLHACLCRAWKTRVKGRDWYDLLFFIARGIPADLSHLKARMRQSGHWDEVRTLESDDVQHLLADRIREIDWKQAKEDVSPFVHDPRSLELWGPGLFGEVVRQIVWTKEDI